MRLVLDTNVVLSGLLWNGPPKQLLDSGIRDSLLYTSAHLIAELQQILSRSKFRKKISSSLLSIGQLVDLYAGLTTIVSPTSIPRVAPDSDDDIVIGTALAARADLVTGDKALLSVESYNGIAIISVDDALRALEERAHARPL